MLDDLQQPRLLQRLYLELSCIFLIKSYGYIHQMQISAGLKTTN